MVQDSDWAAGGQVFSTDNSGGSQNYILQNLWLTVDQTQTTGLWGIIVGMGSSEDADYLSDNVVLDRVVLRGGAVGTNMNVGLGMDGKHSVVVFLDRPDLLKCKLGYGCLDAVGCNGSLHHR